VTDPPPLWQYSRNARSLTLTEIRALTDAVDREAVALVVRHVASFAVALGREDLADCGRENYPDIGEDDWHRVLTAAEATLDRLGQALLGEMDEETYQAAYARLAARAETTAG